MKTEEDEAFEDIERRQGGGFQAKRAAAADKAQDESDMLTIAYLDGYERGKKAALAQPAQEPVAFDSFLESQDFYELMQTYRHCQIDAHISFEAVKDALRAVHIKAALAQPAQEPVCDKDPQGCWNVRCQLGKKCINTTPPKRKWIGLTDEEMLHIGVATGLERAAVEMISNKLKDKNA